MAKKAAVSYSEAYEELENIIEELNNEKLDIDLLSQNVKRGIELIALCQSKLKNAEKEVSSLFESEQEK